ncbi:MAG: type II toxin-antitoxin system VapC family toxin [Bosea sp. (in: a-proteobacteria)]|uniref:type II toxin-antitoxin system VapC family toxin n=1 Tax=Bosea sp. (in: a-proteobacteria) TaxID=1871050 RepID=UPI003F7C03E1
MRAIDTNVVVRFLTADDRQQAKAARAAIEAGDIFVATTVLLESEWVLRSGYGFAAARIADGLSGLAGLPGVTVEEPGLLARAIEWLRDGMDFADALHLAKAGDCDVFLSFDRKLAKVARKRAPIPVRSP